MKVGVVGCGYWGPNLLRNFLQIDGVTVVGCADLRPERRQHIERRHPGVVCVESHEELLAMPGLDAVVIATPISTHHAVAKAALLRGKHVMVEKPLAGSSEHCRELVAIAEQSGLILMVDHTFLFTTGPCKVRRMTVVGTHRMLVYDDVEPVEKVRIYDKCVYDTRDGLPIHRYYDTFEEFRLAYRHGDVVIPSIPSHEPLATVCQEFVEAIRAGKPHQSSGAFGLRVVRILEKAEASLRQSGQAMPL
ncbi:MAG: Gfo/Idh/MocA family oxidoreductase [Candidatus Riflebacteria bacterium]|nr:Gfo/Idh/MocA family oxidoreductase [Candidatus Riflebacteria bacterium]